MNSDCSKVLKFDLHIHSKYSFDSLLTVEKIIKTAEKKKLDGIAICDHDSLKGGLKAKMVKTDLLVIPGEEIKTDLGEIIGYFLNEEIKTKNFFEAISAIETQDGLICLPHPYRPQLKLNDKQIKMMGMIEVLNGRNDTEKNNKAQRLAKKFDKKFCAGSDAHLQVEIGSCYTMLECERDLDSVKNELINGNPKIGGKEIPTIISKGSIALGKITKKMRR
jgi:predicted metal-dependent phosphoesterase TrpH